MNTEITKSIPPISAEALKLREYLRKVEEGTVVDDSTLSSIAGRTIKKAKGMIRSAIKALEKEAIVFYRVRNVGIRREKLSTASVVEGESTVPQRAGRMFKRSLRRLAAVRFNELSNDDKLRHSAVSGQVGALAMFSSPKAHDKIYAATIGNGQKVDNTKLLDLFKE